MEVDEGTEDIELISKRAGRLESLVFAILLPISMCWRAGILLSF
jgi:hypothetical protein